MASEDATVNRIITHMNNDHHDTVVRYLEHYCSVPSYTAQHARITSISLTRVGVSVSAKERDTYAIPIDPPMQSFAEARPRLVQMDKDCIAGLGRSDITLKQYRFAKSPLHVSVLIACLFTFITFSRRANLVESTAFWPFDKLAARFPETFAWFYDIQPRVIYPMVAIHLGEASWMARSRLSKHSVL